MDIMLFSLSLVGKLDYPVGQGIYGVKGGWGILAHCKFYYISIIKIWCKIQVVINPLVKFRLILFKAAKYFKENNSKLY